MTSVLCAKNNYFSLFLLNSNIFSHKARGDHQVRVKQMHFSEAHLHAHSHLAACGVGSPRAAARAASRGPEGPGTPDTGEEPGASWPGPGPAVGGLPTESSMCFPFGEQKCTVKAINTHGLDLSAQHSCLRTPSMQTVVSRTFWENQVRPWLHTSGQRPQAGSPAW